jgi:hypothetical protein
MQLILWLGCAQPLHLPVFGGPLISGRLITPQDSQVSGSLLSSCYESLLEMWTCIAAESEPCIGWSWPASAIPSPLSSLWVRNNQEPRTKSLWETWSLWDVPLSEDNSGCIVGRPLPRARWCYSLKDRSILYSWSLLKDWAYRNKNISNN